MKETKVITKKRALIFGLVWAVIMILFTQLLFPLFNGEEIKYSRLVLSVPVWLIAGLGFGFFNRYMQKRSLKKSNR